MSCIVLVLENPYWSRTEEGGRKAGHYEIKNVPAGTYQLKAWHERLPPSVQTVTVPETGQVAVDFTMGIKNLPTP